MFVLLSVKRADYTLGFTPTTQTHAQFSVALNLTTKLLGAKRKGNTWYTLKLGYNEDRHNLICESIFPYKEIVEGSDHHTKEVKKYRVVGSFWANSLNVLTGKRTVCVLTFACTWHKIYTPVIKLESFIEYTGLT